MKFYDGESTGNEIGVEGAKTISEMLRVNQTLMKLNLRGE